MAALKTRAQSQSTTGLGWRLLNLAPRILEFCWENATLMNRNHDYCSSHNTLAYGNRSLAYAVNFAISALCFACVL